MFYHFKLQHMFILFFSFSTNALGSPRSSLMNLMVINLPFSLRVLLLYPNHLLLPARLMIPLNLLLLRLFMIWVQHLWILILVGLYSLSTTLSSSTFWHFITAFYLWHGLASSTWKTYSSGQWSYIEFIRIHPSLLQAPGQYLPATSNGILE